MTAKKKAAKPAAKKKAVKRRPAARKAPKGRPARKAAGGAKRAAKRPVSRAKVAPKAPKAALREAGVGAAVPVTAFSLERVQVAPLRYEAAAALGRLETVQLLAGANEEGARVETLVFAPSGSAVQASGEYVHRGQWNGTRLVTDKGHLLDVDGSCFCRDCEAAGGFTVDDDE